MAKKEVDCSILSGICKEFDGSRYNILTLQLSNYFDCPCMKYITGFSKLSKAEKIDWLTETYFENAQKAKELLQMYWNADQKLQKLHDEFSENTISNYYLPFGIAPNFKINEQLYAIPLAIEESSVVAAASKAAKFWGDKGGFKAEVISTIKSGQVHFMYAGDNQVLEAFFESVKTDLKQSVRSLTQNMEKRGGGLLAIELRNKTTELANYYQLDCSFETVDAMGANFINSCLEKIADSFEDYAREETSFEDYPIQIVMSILSNYVPECLVRAEVSAPVNTLHKNPEEAEEFAQKFVQAIQIAQVEPKRAVTHNKGVMNGVDAVVLATGNDFRAIEACAHAYAAKDGRYSSLTHAEIKDGIFRFWIEIPLALGTVGGLTSLHPLVKLAMELLGHPSAKELMKITAVVGLAQNFGAVSSLVTTGIQEGHMKMHLMNILNQLEATRNERREILEYFKHHTVSHAAVMAQFKRLREEKSV